MSSFPLAAVATAGVAVVAGAPAAVGVAGAVVVAGAAGFSPAGTEVAVGAACRACGLSRTGEWGPRTGAVLAAPRLAARKKLSGGSEYDRGYAMGYAVCRRGEVKDDVPLLDSAGRGPFARGWTDGVLRCRAEHRVAGRSTTRGSLDPSANFGM